MRPTELISIPVSPYFLEEHLYKTFRIQQLLDENETLKMFINRQGKDRTVLHQILEVLNQFSSGELGEAQVNELMAVLPFVFARKAHDKNGKLVERVPFKNVKRYDDRLELEEYLEVLVERICSKLKRSEQNIDLPAGMSEDQILTQLEKDINKKYDAFYQEVDRRLTETTVLKGEIKSNKVIRQLIFADYRIYPALPALLALSAAAQIICNQSPSKERLLAVNLAPHVEDIKIADTRVIYEELMKLTSELEKILAENLGSLYQTVSFPKENNNSKSKDYFFQWLDGETFGSGNNFRGNKKEENWDKYFSRHMTCPVPVCRSHLVASKLAQFAKLDVKKTVKLHENITKYLLDSNYCKNQIKEEYGKTLLHLIEFFRKFVQPDIYYEEVELKELFQIKWKQLKMHERKFFSKSDQEMGDEAIKKFFNTYFMFMELSKELIYRSAPYRPYTGNGKVLPKYYRKSVADFYNEPSGKKEIRKRIQQHLTLHDAIELVLLHENEHELFGSRVNQHWKEIKKQYLRERQEGKKPKFISWEDYESTPENSKVDKDSKSSLLYDEAMYAVGFYFAELVRIAPYYTKDTAES